jgi:hypothetical protein
MLLLFELTYFESVNQRLIQNLFLKQLCWSNACGIACRHKILVIENKNFVKNLGNNSCVSLWTLENTKCIAEGVFMNFVDVAASNTVACSFGQNSVHFCCTDMVLLID